MKYYYPGGAKNTSDHQRDNLKENEAGRKRISDVQDDQRAKRRVERDVATAAAQSRPGAMDMLFPMPYMLIPPEKKKAACRRAGQEEAGGCGTQGARS
jgi:hypothetical protein